MRVVHSIEAACSIDRLWSFVDQPAKFQQWVKDVLEYVPTDDDGARRAGSRFRMTIQEGRKAAEYHGTVTAYDPPRHLGVALTGGSFKDNVMRVEYRLHDLGGRTRLDYQAEMELRGALRLFGWLFQLFGGMQIRSFCRALKRLAEETADRGIA